MKKIRDTKERLNDYKSRFKRLINDSSKALTQWRSLSEYIDPTKGRYLAGSGTHRKEEGSADYKKVINGTAGLAVQILASGMLGGLTSPSRPWFSLVLEDEELMEYAPVKAWLHDVRALHLSAFAKSNFYGVLHNMYKELATFGTNSFLIEKDFETTIRCRAFTIGEYRLFCDHTGRVTGMMREFMMTANQLYEKFGEDAVSTSVKRAYDNKNGLEYFKVHHVIEKNPDHVEGDLRPGKQMYSSVYYEVAGTDKFLRESGYSTKPFVAPRWDVTAEDIYGYGPGHLNLGDIKMLQVMERDKLKSINKAVDPPMIAPTSMKGKGGTIIAGGVNYLDTQAGQQTFAPAYTVRPDLQGAAFEIDRVETRIRQGFYNDLFNATLGVTKRMTATEVSERQTEKLIQLGPIIERLQSELLDPVIERTYSILEEAGKIPTPPEELQGSEFKIEYISLLAQAQKMVGTTSIEQVAAFIGNLAAVQPEIIDKMDFDETVDQYAEMLGVPPKVIRTDDDVAEIRRGRAQAQMQAQQQEQVAQQAQTAKVMSETEVGGGDTALDQVLGG